ncbi:MAG: hypothetical protein Q7S41_02270, partial [Candidatus Limnocylindria bacterium]|nr:hypothetical protein [Candidatus Limnocylindria bacterium]
VRISALSTAAYVLAFWSGNFQLRAIFGTTELLVVLGLTTLVIGSSLGVTVQILLGTGQTVPTSPDLVGAHATAQTGGYLVLVAAGFIEWQLTGGGKRSMLGLVQVGLLFIGGLLLSFSLLSAAQIGPDLAQALPGIATLFTLAGILIIAFRLGRAALGVSWVTGGARHIAVAVGFLVLAVVLQAILVQQFIASQGDFTKISVGLLHALDHSFFVGLMTNVLFGAILVLTADRPRAWPWADNVIFWGLNLGAAAFITVLLTAGSGEGKAAFTHPVAFVAPIMGLSALLGIATLLMRLQGAPAPEIAPART